MIQLGGASALPFILLSMADIQVGTVVLPMDAIAYTLRTNCGNKDWTVASGAFSELMTAFYPAIGQCADAVTYTPDEREAMAFQCKTAVEIINEQGTAYYQWAYDRYYQAPGHGLWGNDASCNKRRGWWYDNTIQPFYGFWNTTQLAWNAADDALALLAQEEEENIKRNFGKISSSRMILLRDKH